MNWRTAWRTTSMRSSIISNRWLQMTVSRSSFPIRRSDRPRGRHTSHNCNSNLGLLSRNAPVSLLLWVFTLL